MVRVFGDDYRRDQCLGRNAALDQMFGLPEPGRHLAVAVAAGACRPARDDDLEARRDHVELFRDVLAELDLEACCSIGQHLSARSMTTSSRGKCLGNAPRLIWRLVRRTGVPAGFALALPARPPPRRRRPLAQRPPA